MKINPHSLSLKGITTGAITGITSAIISLGLIGTAQADAMAILRSKMSRNLAGSPTPIFIMRKALLIT